MSTQLIDAVACAGGDEDRRLLRESVNTERVGDGARAVHSLRHGEAIALRHDDQAAINPEQGEDLEMLSRLRHDTLVGGDDEKRDVDAGGARDHRPHQALMPRHVDEADCLIVRAGHVREAEVDRDAARLLFLQAIGVDAGQRADERGLAVVDVARCTDDHALAAAASSTCASIAWIVCSGNRARTLGRKRAARRLPRRAANVR